MPSGGGLELDATHIRVAEPSSFYALPEKQRGIFGGGGGFVRIPRLIGVARVAEMMPTGHTYGARDGSVIATSDDEAKQRLADFLEKRAAKVSHAKVSNAKVAHD